MHRCLAVLLLMLLPLQFSWAALANYCQHEGGQTARHVGHHDHQHLKTSGSAAETKAGKLPAGSDSDCCACHAHCLGAVADTMPFAANGGAFLIATAIQPQPVGPPPMEPERPKWLPHA